MSEVKKERVLKAGAGYVIGNYLLKGISFLAIPLFARLMRTEDYGIYNTFIAYEGILFVLIGWAIHSSYKNANLRFNRDGVPYQYGTYISDTMVLVIATSLVYLVIANILVTFFPNLLKLSRLEINLLVLYSFGTAIIVCYNTDVAVRYEAGSFLKVAATNALLNIGLSTLLILTVFREQRYEGRILGTVIPAFGLGVFICIKYLRKNRPEMNREQLKWGMKYSLPIIPHGISQRILGSFDRIMITNMVGASQSGIYSFASNIALILSVTYQATDTVWTQWFYDRRKNDRVDSIRKYSAVYMLLILAATAALMLVAPELIRIIGTKEYEDSVYCVFPVLASTYFTFLYNIPSVVEYYHEKTKNIAMATACAAGLNIILNYLFIKWYGYVAAAYTTLATYLLYFMFHWIMARKIDRKDLLPTKIIIACIAGNFAAMVLAMAMMKMPVPRWILAIAIMGIAAWYGEKEIRISKMILKRLGKG